IAAVVAGVVPPRFGFSRSTLAAGSVPGSFQVARFVLETGKFGAQVNRRAAALAVIGAHGQITGPPVDAGPDGELPTAAHAGDFQVILAGRGQLAEIRRLHAIAGIGIVHRGSEGGAECYPAVPGAAHGELGWSIFRGRERHLGRRRRISYLIDLDLDRGNGGESVSGREEEKRGGATKGSITAP